MEAQTHIEAARQRIERTGHGIDAVLAAVLARTEGAQVMELLAAANSVRERFKGKQVRLCGIVNAKSGLCSQDCAFCAQSRVAEERPQTYPLLENERLVKAAARASQAGAREFSIVTSGRAATSRELVRITQALGQVRQLGLDSCASLGALDQDQLVQLRQAGLVSFHHNLETARSHYPQIVSTRSYDENLAAVHAAKAAGLRVCCGGIFGLGETWDQRIELLAELAGLDIDSVPINFLNPIAGTPLGEQPLLEPVQGLKILALARLMMPRRDIVVAGGRERVLGQLQAMVFFAGANGLLIGDYLTTSGRSAAEDLALVAACGLEPAGPSDPRV